MSVYPNITDQDRNNLGELPGQQKNQKTIKLETKLLKQIHDKKLAESFNPK